jgi:hypothetical protein
VISVTCIVDVSMIIVTKYWLYGFGPSYTRHSLVLLNKFSLIIPCHIFFLN